MFFSLCKIIPMYICCISEKYVFCKIPFFAKNERFCFKSFFYIFIYILRALKHSKIKASESWTSQLTESASQSTELASQSTELGVTVNGIGVTTIGGYPFFVFLILKNAYFSAFFIKNHLRILIFSH